MQNKKRRHAKKTNLNDQGKKQNRSAGAKALHLLKDIFVWLVVIAAIAMMIFTIVSVTTFDRNERSLFGYQMFIVRTDSMSATDFDSGDLVFTKQVDPATLQVGDIIAFRSTNPDNFGEIVTHKIRALTTTQNGVSGFITYGTTTNIDDPTPVTYEYVIGKYEGHFPKVGTFFTYLKTTPGYICCILIPFMLLIIIQGANSIKLFRQYQQEKADELRAERDQLASEREETRRMMEELTKMQEQMAQGLSPAGAPYQIGDNNDAAVTHIANREQGTYLFAEKQKSGGTKNEQDKEISRI